MDPISGQLAPYALRAEASRGRAYPDEPHPYRNPFQRDRDRIVHSASFRRLMGKTQVLTSDASDHHRTRLTHTLEVAQLSRTLARQLGLNEDLTEAVALAHDLGHPPFGHAGEEALAAAMQAHGGFEHNRHGLRLVDELEERYPGHPGLNLTWEVRAAFAYHSKQPAAPEIAALRLPELPHPYLEAQLVDAADSVAYDAHDVDDALNLGLVSLDDLRGVELWRQCAAEAEAKHGPLSSMHLQAAVVRRLVDRQATDLLEETRRRLEASQPGSPEAAMRAPGLMAESSAALAPLRQELEAFLHARVYRHEAVRRMTERARQLLAQLFAALCGRPERLPPACAARIPRHGLERTVCDFLAGLTDRSAQEAPIKLFHEGRPL